MTLLLHLLFLVAAWLVLSAPVGVLVGRALRGRA